MKMTFILLINMLQFKNYRPFLLGHLEVLHRGRNSKVTAELLLKYHLFISMEVADQPAHIKSNRKFR